MGWRGALRAYAAAARASERQAIREQRRLMKEMKERDKRDQLHAARMEVDEYNNLIERLTTMHQDCSPAYEWESIKCLPEPVAPSLSNQKEKEAHDKLINYVPSFFDRLLRRVSQNEARLRSDVEKARQSDSERHDKALKEYEGEVSEWHQLQTISAGVLRGDLSAYAEVLQEFSPFHELDGLGSKIRVQYKAKDAAEIDFHVNGTEIIPSASKTLLRNGMLSIKKMGQSQYHQLYQDYVASAVLRIGREIFAILPLERVTVTAQAKLLDSSTGKYEARPLISVLFQRDIMRNLKFDALDPSDSLQNFLHNSDFKKNRGFGGTDRLAISPAFD